MGAFVYWLKDLSDIDNTVPFENTTSINLCVLLFCNYDYCKIEFLRGWWQWYIYKRSPISSVAEVSVVQPSSSTTEWQTCAVVAVTDLGFLGESNTRSSAEARSRVGTGAEPSSLTAAARHSAVTPGRPQRPVTMNYDHNRQQDSTETVHFRFVYTWPTR